VVSVCGRRRAFGLCETDVLAAHVMDELERERRAGVRRLPLWLVAGDLGNDLFEAMLDARMTHSCGYWRRARDLDAAQEEKLDLICRKIGVARGMRVLDIGSGSGSFAIFAAERYGAQVVGITVSEPQRRLATERGRGPPVEFRVQDYRDVDEGYDAIVSIGMFEHVGVKNYGTYFEVARRCLQPGGLFLLHHIGSRATSSPGRICRPRAR
jgi:cyclopropane-fatty-acyl-phospholipid synthase